MRQAGSCNRWFLPSSPFSCRRRLQLVKWRESEGGCRDLVPFLLSFLLLYGCCGLNFFFLLRQSLSLSVNALEMNEWKSRCIIFFPFAFFPMLLLSSFPSSFNSKLDASSSQTNGMVDWFPFTSTERVGTGKDLFGDFQEGRKKGDLALDWIIFLPAFLLFVPLRPYEWTVEGIGTFGWMDELFVGWIVGLLGCVWLNLLCSFAFIWISTLRAHVHVPLCPLLSIHLHFDLISCLEDRMAFSVVGVVGHPGVCCWGLHPTLCMAFCSVPSFLSSFLPFTTIDLILSDDRMENSVLFALRCFFPPSFLLSLSCLCTDFELPSPTSLSDCSNSRIRPVSVSLPHSSGSVALSFCPSVFLSVPWTPRTLKNSRKWRMESRKTHWQVNSMTIRFPFSLFEWSLLFSLSALASSKRVFLLPRLTWCLVLRVFSLALRVIARACARLPDGLCAFVSKFFCLRPTIEQRRRSWEGGEKNAPLAENKEGPGTQGTEEGRDTDTRGGGGLPPLPMCEESENKKALVTSARLFSSFHTMALLNFSSVTASLPCVWKDHHNRLSVCLSFFLSFFLCAFLCLFLYFFRSSSFLFLSLLLSCILACLLISFLFMWVFFSWLVSVIFLTSECPYRF